MTGKILEPVLNNDDEPCWLVFNGMKTISNPPSDKPLKEAIKSSKPLKEIKSFEIKPMGLFQCGKCGCVIHSPSGEKPAICYQDQGGCDRASDFAVVTEKINTDLWKIPKWSDIPIQELDMLSLYDDALALIKNTIIFSKEIEYKIFVLWIFSTWKLECWDAVGYPIFIGIPNSGKSRALRVIHNLAYRAPKASGVKAAAVPRLSHYYNITLLIDEAHTKMNPKTESGADLLNFVKDSYKRDSVYISCDNNDQKKLIVTKNFGFKAFAGEKTFNPALITRSLIFWMEKGNPELSKLTYATSDFDKIRTGLLNYRYKTDAPEDLGNDFCLRGRTREVFESIIATGKHIGVPVDDVIEYAKKRDIAEEEALKNTVPYEILVIIRDYQANPTLFPDDAPDEIKINTIIDKLGWLSDESQEKRRATQSLGYILKDMGLTTKKTKEGRVVLLQDENNKERLDQLNARYKL